MSLLDRVQDAWSVLTNKNESRSLDYGGYGGNGFYSGPPFMRGKMYSQNSITSPVFNRIAMDVASVSITHVKISPEDQSQITVNDDLNNRLNFESNIDQSGRSFIQDVVYSMMDDGVVAIVPTDTDKNIFDLKTIGGFNIKSWRVAKIIEWLPRAVRVEVYNDRTGNSDQLTLPKNVVAIIQNPLYSTMNGSNSTLSRLTKAIQQVDQMDNKLLSDRMNLLISLPYALKSERKKEEAERRLNEIETQLNHSQFGIAYVDQTEKITQLNRPLDNTLLQKAENLSKEFMNQLGLTPGVVDGTASEVQMKNYYNRTIDPIVNAVIDELTRKFLTQTAISQGHKILAYRDPFSLVQTEKIADMAKSLVEGRIARPNEMRPKLGLQPIPKEEDPVASQLSNPNVDTLNGMSSDGQPEDDNAPVEPEPQDADY